jgi:hypothetical protein
MSVSPGPKGGEPQGRVRVNPVASALHATTDHKAAGLIGNDLEKSFACHSIGVLANGC